MKAYKYIFGVFILILGLIGLSIGNAPDANLHLIACDVGQGDAILAVYKDAQILIDGGPGDKVLECLSRYVPFWDRDLELVVLTHPQLDHYGGLIEVFRRYNVDTFLANGLDSGASSYQALKNAVGGNGARVITPKEGMVLRVGMIYLDILAPTQGLLAQEDPDTKANILGGYSSKKDPNDFSIVAILRLGEFDALFTGDIGPAEIPEILATGKVREVEYIKIPHHGSSNGITQDFLNITQPKIAVISVGKNNSYGHPKKEVLDMLFSVGAKVFRTDESGDVHLETDGENFEVH